MIRRLLAAALITILTSCAGKLEEPVSGSDFLLGTSCFITIHQVKGDADPEQLIEESFRIIAGMENRVSVNIENSEIARLNRSEGEPQSVSEDTFAVLSAARNMAELSGGRFDPTIGALVSLWGIGTDRASVPPDRELTQALNTINIGNLELMEDNLVSLNGDGTRIDLGGIAKGHAADLVREYLTDRGVTSGIINLGGNVLLIGEKSGGDSWRIGVQDPLEPRGEYLGILSVRDKAVVTSGVYERYFIYNGVQYHHILDTETGYPVSNGVVSATVVADDSMTADGFSTALFSLGIRKGIETAERIDGIEAVLVNDDQEVYMTSGLRGRFNLTTTKGYRIVSESE